VLPFWEVKDVVMRVALAVMNKLLRKKLALLQRARATRALKEARTSVQLHAARTILKFGLAKM